MTAVGQSRPFGDAGSMSGLPPCVDGSELARRIFTSQIGRCSHVFGLLVRFTRPLAIMPSADQVPVKSPHSTMLGGSWVVLIAGIDRLCITCCSPSQPSHHAGCPARSRYAASATGSL